MKRIWFWGSVALAIIFVIGFSQFNSCTPDSTQGQNRSAFSGGLKILSATPNGLVDDIDQFYAVVVVFSKTMVPLQALPEGDGAGPLVIEPPIKGKFRWMGTNTLAFIPTDTLPVASRFNVTVPNTVKALDGERLAQSYQWSFETLRPKFIRSSIQDNSKEIDLSPTIYLLFNQKISLASAREKINLFNSSTKLKTSIRVDHPDSAQIRDYLDRYNYGYYYDEEYSQSQSSQDILGRLLKIVPTQKLDMATDYELNIDSGLKGIGGNLGTVESKKLHFTTYGAFEFQYLSAPEYPTYPIKIKFSNKINAEDLRDHLSFKPAAEIRDVYESYWDDEYSAVIYAELKPQTRYEVRFEGSLKDIHGNALGQDVVRSFQTGDYEPNVFFPTGSHVIESYLSHDLNVSVLNPKTVTLRLGKLMQNDLILAFNQNFEWAETIDYDQWSYQRSGTPPVTKNQQQLIPIKLDEALGGDKSGAVLVELQHETWNRPRRAIVQITDIGITAKYSRLNNLIYLTSLKDGTPISGAFLEIRDYNGQVKWSGQSDEKGFAETPGWGELGIVPVNEWNEPTQWIFAQKGDQKAFTSSNMNVELYRFRMPISWRVREDDEVSGFLFTNQGIYRPGDKVYVKGLARKIHQGAWSLPESEQRSVKIIIKNPSYEEIWSKNIMLNDVGAFDVSYDIDPNAALGYYSIQLQDGRQIASESFQVQEFKPVETEVTVQTKKTDYVWGEKFEATLDGHYLFGMPVSNTEIQWSVTRSKSYFEPPGYDGYYFGPISDYDYYDYYQESSYSSVLASGTEKLNDRGLLKIALPLNNAGKSETSNLVIEGTIQDKNRQVVSGRKNVTVHAGQYYAGIKPSTTFMNLGEPFSIDAIAVTENGEKLSGKKIDIEIVHREWISVREKASDGSYQWSSMVKDSIEGRMTIQSGKDPVTQVIAPKTTGYYRIIATAKDDLGNTITSSCYVYVTGADYAGWRMDNGDYIDIVANKTNYNPGETAKILVKSPYSKTRAMVTVEREGILWHKTFDLKGNASLVEVPVTKDMIPNAFISVILIQGRTSMPTAERLEDLGKPAFKIGYVQLAVNAEENKLNVAVKPNKEKFSPNEWVDVDVAVRDHQGRGKLSEVSLYVEDIGVLNLVNYQTPQPFDHFYKPRDLAVTTSENRRYVLDQIVSKDLKEKGGVGGGGDEASYQAIAVRSNFKSCVYWNPSVRTDANGKAKVRFQLPENLTGFRIIAVAHTATSQFGSAAKDITVSKQLMLRPALPRFARVGDEVEAGVLVHNYSDKDGTVKIFASMDGAHLSDQPLREMTIKKGGAEEVRYKFKVTENKTGTFTFKAVMNDLTDGVEVKIPLRVPSYTETVALSGSSLTDHREEVIVPKDIFEDFGGLEVQTASTALAELDGSVQYLFDYPYGCLEQKTSRALPVILFGDVVKAFNLPAFRDGGSDIEQVIQNYVDDVPRYQTYNGGFSYWPGSEYESPYVSVYAMFALNKAREKGFYINNDCFNRGLNYLKTLVRNPRIDRYGLAYWHTTNAFALNMLAENGYYDAPTAELYFQRRDEMPLYARAMLLSAIYKGRGNQAMIEELKRNITNAIKMASTTAHFEEPNESGMEWTFHSNMRTTAAVLQVFLEMDGENVPWAEKVVQYILQERKLGRWRTTQENAYVFWALGTYFSIFEKTIPDFSSRVLLDSKEILNEMYKGRTTKNARAELTLANLRKETPLPLEFKKSGDGRVYYTVRMTYAPKSGVPIKARDEGIKVVKTFEDMSGHVVSSGRFTAGEMYQVKLSISSAQDRYFVVVDDPLPAGFEAINVNLATSSDQYAQKVSRTKRWWWSWGDFNNSELRDDRVVVFADYFSKGTHTYTYLVRATTYGQFELPTTKAEEMYMPEVFGTTTNQTIWVQ